MNLMWIVFMAWALMLIALERKGVQALRNNATLADVMLAMCVVSMLVLVSNS